MGRQTVIKVFIKTKQGEFAGRAPEKSLKDFLDRVNGEGSVLLEDPSYCGSIQTPVTNDKGEVQLVDGSWIPQQRAGQIGPENLMLRNILRMTSMKVDTAYFNNLEWTMIRELAAHESDEYNKAIQAGKLSSTKLATNTKGIELPPEVDGGQK